MRLYPILCFCFLFCFENALGFQWTDKNSNTELSFLKNQSRYTDTPDEEAKVQPECECQDGFIEVNSDQTWTSDQIINNNLIVRTGSRLTLDSILVEMAPNCKIYVERGARIDAIHSTLTTGCEDIEKYWSGIEIWGNGLLNHPLYTVIQEGYPFTDEEHGVVYLEYCIVSRAKLAVLTDNLQNGGHETYWQPYGTWGNHYGGIIQALKSKFINNIRTAHIAAFPATYLTGNIANASHFKDCIFQDTSNVSDRGISVWGSEGVIFEGNQFIDLNGYSLSFDNASGFVYKNTFENFETGIKATYTPGHIDAFELEIGNKTFPERGNRFINGSPVGIRAENQQELEVHHNSFENIFVPIAVSGSSRFQVSSNRFTNFYVGAQLHNTATGLGGGASDFNCNYFEASNARDAIRVWGKCNNFEFEQETFNLPTGDDIRLIRSGSILGEIESAQGSHNSPVLNIFSGPQSIIAPPSQTNPFTYYYPGENLTSLFPDLQLEPNSSGQNFAAIFGDDSLDDYNDGCLDLEGVGGKPGITHCKNQECLDSINQLLAQKHKILGESRSKSLQKTLTADISDLNAQRSEALHHLYQTAVRAGDWATAENLLLQEGSFSSMQKLIGLKMHIGAFDEANDYLRSLPVETDDQYIVAKLLGLEIAYNANPVGFKLSDRDENYLERIAADTLSATYTYSRALLSTISGAEFHLPIAPDFEVEGMVQQDQGGAVPQQSKARTVEMVLFPNPADDQVTVTLPTDAAPEWRLEVWSSSGICVRSLEIGSNQHDFKLENLPAGFYVVKAINKVEPLQLQQRLIVR